MEAIPQNYFQDLLDHMLEGCQVIDRGWRYVYLNDVAAQQGQRKKEDLIGLTMMEAYPGIEHTELFFRILQAMENGVSHCMENEFQFPDGSKGWFELRIEPIPIGVFIMSIDISERRKMDQLKSDFLAMASHQLRTPLSAAKWTLELFLKDEELSEQHRQKIYNLFIENERLIALVNNLLKVSNIEAGRWVPNPEPLSIIEAIQSSVDALKPKADQKNQDIVIETTAPSDAMYADRVIFAEAFDNILADAIEYGNPDSTITVRITLKDDVFHVSVHDIGLLIRPEDAEHIFTKFYRSVEAEYMVPSGSGLGLFIAKAAVTANGGKIWFASEKNVGTTFHFTVPSADWFNV